MTSCLQENVISVNSWEWVGFSATSHIYLFQFTATLCHILSQFCTVCVIINTFQVQVGVANAIQTVSEEQVKRPRPSQFIVSTLNLHWNDKAGRDMLMELLAGGLAQTKQRFLSDTFHYRNFCKNPLFFMMIFCGWKLIVKTVKNGLIIGLK